MKGGSLYPYILEEVDEIIYSFSLESMRAKKGKKYFIKRVNRDFLTNFKSYIKQNSDKYDTLTSLLVKVYKNTLSQYKNFINALISYNMFSSKNSVVIKEYDDDLVFLKKQIIIIAPEYIFDI